MFEISEGATGLQYGAKIKVIGVGGGGCNAVNTMIKSGLAGVEYIVANTDAQALNANLAPTKIQLGAEVTKGLGAGANPEVGRKAALEEYEKLSEVLIGADMVFITAGMGGGTGTGAAPIIAKLCKELGALTVGVITKPFLFEGKKRFRQAENGINALEEVVDSLITIPNQRLLYLAGESLSLVETFKRADEVLLNAVRGISDLINNTGHINADFADVSTVMSNKGLALMGTGICSGQDRAIKAATEAISSPLLEDVSINGATGIIINITGNESLTMHEANEAVTLIMEAADEDAEIIFGTVIDDSMEDMLKVTVVATGLGGAKRVTSAQLKENAQELKRTEQTHAVAPETTQPESRMEARAEREVAQPASIVKEERIETIIAKDMAAEKNSTLVQTIRDAASRYEATKTRPLSVSSEEKTETQDNSFRTTNDDSRDHSRNTRARTIAEKLGFINFDEEELDTPSFMRKDEVAKKPVEKRDFNRNLDI